MSIFEERTEEQEKFIKDLSEEGGYCFIPDSGSPKKERGIVIKVEKGGKISDAVLSFGYSKTVLNKEQVIGKSVEELIFGLGHEILKGPIERGYMIERHRVQETREPHYFDIDHGRASDEEEFNKYKLREEVRNKRYEKSLQNPSDPLESKLSYGEVKKKCKIPDGSDLDKQIGRNVANFNFEFKKAIRRLYELRQSRRSR